MRAVSENPDGAALAGISINRVLYISFGLSTALAVLFLPGGLAGGLDKIKGTFSKRLQFNQG